MKKMMFALACASTFALFADVTPINSIDFEGYQEVPFTGLSLKTDAGSAQWSELSKEVNWLYMPGGSGSEDASTVRAYDPAQDGNAKYLDLSTEGGTLWRSINGLTGGGEVAVRLGEAVSLVDEVNAVTKKLYIDTMVQFTVSEDENGPTNLSGGDKLAIWLQASGEGAAATTNLMVRCTALSASGAGQPASFTLVPVNGSASLDVSDGGWHSLKVENSIFGGIISVFRIYLDDELMKATVSPIDETGFGDYGTPDDDMLAGKVFPSLEPDSPILAAVGFQGTGKIDDLSFSEEEVVEEEQQPVGFTIKIADGVTVKWFTDDGWVALNDTATALPGSTVQLQLTNADGATKEVTVTIETDATETVEFDLSSESFGWAEYLGATISGVYVIDDEDELIRFQKGVTIAKLPTQGETFKLENDVPFAEDAVAWTAIEGFAGTFDGNGKTISNVTLVPAKYTGFFGTIDGATIKNLTIVGNGFGNAALVEDNGCAIIVGQTTGSSTISGCTSKGEIAAATHNVAGILVNVKSGTTIIENCVNEADLASPYTKIGGILAINNGTVTIKNCSNSGKITVKYKEGTTYPTDGGYSGILAYATGVKNTIEGCSNTGVIELESGVTAAYRGQIIGYLNHGLESVSGANAGRDDMLAIGYVGTDNADESDKLRYATVGDNNVVTYRDTLVVGQTYLVTAPNAAPTIELAAGTSIAFDQTLATIDATGITTVDGYKVDQFGTGTDTITYTSTEDGPVVTPLEPGAESDTTFEAESDEALKAALEAYEVKLTSEDEEYGLKKECLVVVAKPVEGQTGVYKAVVVLNPDKVPVPVIEASTSGETQTPAIDITETGNEGEMDVTVNVPNAVQGVWYGFESGSDVSQLEIDPATFRRAGQGGVKLDTKANGAKKFGAMGFFRVKALPAQPPAAK